MTLLIKKTCRFSISFNCSHFWRFSVCCMYSHLEYDSLSVQFSNIFNRFYMQAGPQTNSEKTTTMQITITKNGKKLKRKERKR